MDTLVSRSLIFAQEEPFDGSGVDSSVLNVIRGSVHNLDLFHVEMKSLDEVDNNKIEVDNSSINKIRPCGEQRVGFLAIGKKSNKDALVTHEHPVLFPAYGVIADVDIDSEHLRALGDLRFTVYGLIKIAKLRTYKVRLSYLPKDKREIVDNVEKDEIDDSVALEDISEDKNDMYEDESRSSSATRDDRGSLGSDEASSGEGMLKEMIVYCRTVLNNAIFRRLC